MDVHVSTGEKCQRHIEVTLPIGEFEPHVEKKLREVQKRAQLSGFRRGKVPLNVISRVYGEAVRKEAIEELLPSILSDVQAQYELKTLGPARLEGVKYDADTGLTFRATVEVEPEVELKKYGGFELQQVVYDVSDEDVAEVLEYLRDQHGWLESVETGAEPGHYVLADVQALDETGFPLLGHKYEDRRFLVKERDDLTAQLVGIKAGEERVVRFHERSADGKEKEGRYRFQVKEVTVKRLPPLDDEFARDLGKVDTLEELRRRLRENLEAEAEMRSRDDLHREIIEELIKSNPLELPEAYFEAYTNAYFEELKNRYEGINENELRQAAHDRTLRYLKWRYLRQAIMAREHLEVTDEELRSHVRALADMESEDAQRRVRKVLNDEQERENLREQLGEEKVLAFLQSRMSISRQRMAYRDRNRSRVITV